MHAIPVEECPGYDIFCMIICLILMQIVVGCGLPQVALLEQPQKLSRVHASDDPEQPELPPTVIAFAFPDNDTSIIGYAIFYKIYYSLADPDIRDDERDFDENSYIGTNNEMQPGDAILRERGFLKLGEYGKSEFEEYYIGHDGSQEAVYIAFNPSGATNADRRKQPIIGYDYPVNNGVKVLARGFIDPRDGSENTETNPGNKFRSFVNDWEYDVDDPDGYHDGDLRRGYNLLGYQPGWKIEDIERCGIPYFLRRPKTLPDGTSVGIMPGKTLRIGFAVYSYGRIPGSLKPITSKPVYVGEVGYPDLHDKNREL